MVSCISVFLGLTLHAQTRILKLVDRDLKEAARQYHYLMKNVPAEKLPKTFENGALQTSGSDWWCSGFYPGTLLYLYQATRQRDLLDEAAKRLKILEKEQFNTSTHDLGFMMFCSFGNAIRINPSAKYQSILLNSARSLASRFSPVVGCIRSWDSPIDYKVIIDNLMNLELLCWATKTTRDSTFVKIAKTHANTTQKNHFRPDYSSYHLVIYNPQTGDVVKKQTVQGAADGSAWARGQAWGLYGFTMMYRETKDARYLEQAQHIAGFILDNPNLPADKVPYWDYNAPGIPNALRDVSAAAIMASALTELSGYVSKDLSKKYLSVVETILVTLSSPVYKAAYSTNGGFILKHSVGNMPAKTEIDVPLTYADYYFVEALIRYKELKSKS